MVQNKLEKQIKIMGTHHGHRAISNNENSLKCVFSNVYRKRNRQESTGQKEKKIKE